MDKLSYALGLGIGRQLAQMGVEGLEADDLAAAINDVINGNDLKMSNREAQALVTQYLAEQEARINAERAEQGKAAKAEELGLTMLDEDGFKRLLETGEA